MTTADSIREAFRTCRNAFPRAAMEACLADDPLRRAVVEGVLADLARDADADLGDEITFMVYLLGARPDADLLPNIVSALAQPESAGVECLLDLCSGDTAVPRMLFQNSRGAPEALSPLLGSTHPQVAAWVAEALGLHVVLDAFDPARARALVGPAFERLAADERVEVADDVTLGDLAQAFACLGFVEDHERAREVFERVLGPYGEEFPLRDQVEFPDPQEYRDEAFDDVRARHGDGTVDPFEPASWPGFNPPTRRDVVEIARQFAGARFGTPPARPSSDARSAGLRTSLDASQLRKKAASRAKSKASRKAKQKSRRR